MIYKKLFLLTLLVLLIGVFGDYILKIEEIWKIKLTENHSTLQIENILRLQEKWQWIGYALVPIYILLKTSITTSILYIGLFFFSKKNITFKNIWNSVLNAEFIFLLVPLLKLVWFYFSQTAYTLEDVQYFYPLSALNITDYKGIEPWLLYPLQTLNLFEFAYIIYLSYQIGYLTKTNADNGLRIVSYSYVPALVLWVTVVMFFTLNYS